MTQIETFQNFKVQYVCVKGNPWFRGNDVATILGYSRPRNAIKDHVPDKYKNTLENLMPASGSTETMLPDRNDQISVFISEAGMYKLVLKSKAKNAEAFSDWVCSEVLPKIRKTGSYSVPGHYSSNNISWKEVFEKAVGREDALHYKVIRYIRSTYPDAETIVSLGEHLQTDHQRMDSYLKGYVGGQPDIMVLRGLPNGNQDVFAIELKNPSGTGELNEKQTEYHERLLLKCHVKTVVSSKYEEVVIALHEHYKEVFMRARLASSDSVRAGPFFELAIADKREEEHDFSTNNSPKYWVRRLKNKTALLKECDKRGAIIDNPMTTLNTKIVEALIATDSQ